MFGLIAGGALVLAYLARFVQDDAFISFLYARNLIQGKGLTWFGDHVEGYTNFLWVMWVALGMKLGVDPIPWSQLGGMIAFGVTLFALWQLGFIVTDSRSVATLGLLLFATNFSVLSYATGGLETMLQTALLTLAMLATSRVNSAKPLTVRAGVGISIVVASAVLTRPDSALPAVIMLGWLLATSSRRGWRVVAALVLPLALLLGAWLAWKLAFYGRLLPNSFQAKVGVSGAALENGCLYVWRFLHWYMLWPCLVLGLGAIVWRRSSFDRRLLPVVSVIGAWLAYVIAVGGDFMEFRFLVPIAPIVFLFLAYLLYEPIGRGWLRRPMLVATLGCLVLVSASAIHALVFRGITPDRTLDSIPMLATFYGRYPDRDWARVGGLMKSELGAVDPIIAVNAVGAIPYYSGFRTVDVLGLNDRFVAEHGHVAPEHYRRPGHRRRASLAYLERRGVNFILGHPTMVPLDQLQGTNAESLQGWVAGAVAFSDESVPDLTLVLMPVTRESGLVLWYLTRSPAIDSLIAVRHWPRRSFGPQSLGAPSQPPDEQVRMR